MGVFYKAVRRALDWGLRAFFREVEVHGREHVPPAGPCLILANHHNGMIDPFLLMAAMERPVSFVAKSTLFGIPVLGQVLRGLGSVPAYRREDEGYSGGKNRALFEAAAAAMEGGRALGIFPEGRSHEDPMLLNFKHGASRIAFDAAARGLPVRVLLAGIHFEKTRGFRGRALVQFGPALGLEDRLGRYAADPRAATVELTAELHARLSERVLTAESEDLLRQAELVERMGVLDASGEDDLKSVFERKKRLLEGYGRLRERVPARVEAFRRDLREYRRFLDQLGVRDAQVAEDYRLGRVLAYAARNTLILGLGLPVVAAGIAGNFVPYLAAWMAGRLGRSPDVRTSVAFIVGAAAFPAWWLGLGAMAWELAGPWAGAGALAVAPLAGALALRWMDRWHRVLRDAWGLWRAVTLPAARARLRRMRARILRRLQRLLELAGSP